MPEEDLELKIAYPHFTGTDYVVAVYDNPDNRPLWNPTNFFFARWLLTDKKKLKQTLSDWLAERPNLIQRLGEEGTGAVFDLEGKYNVKLGDERSRRKLTDLTASELFEAARAKIRQRFGSYNMMDLGYKEFFFLDGQRSRRLPHSGGIVLNSSVKPKQGGNKDTRFHKVLIGGPFENNKMPFALLSCGCDDFFFAEGKEGYTPVQLGCIDIAATLLLASYHPEHIRNLTDVLKETHSRVRLPFHVHDPHEKGLAYLMVDAVFNSIFNGHRKFDTSKTLAKIRTIYDKGYLLDRLSDGRAGFEAVVDKYHFGINSNVSPPVRQWFENMDSHYTSQGFQFNRMVVEFKDSPHETIAMEYTKGNESRRMIFGNFPPLERKMVFDEAVEPDVFYLEDQKEQPDYVNPYAQLFHPHYGQGIILTDFDDASRRMPVFSEYRIPWHIFVPDEMLPDYHDTIEAYYQGGNETFKRWLYERNSMLKTSHYKGDRIKDMGLFLKISKSA